MTEISFFLKKSVILPYYCEYSKNVDLNDFFSLPYLLPGISCFFFICRMTLFCIELITNLTLHTGVALEVGTTTFGSLTRKKRENGIEICTNKSERHSPARAPRMLLNKQREERGGIEPEGESPVKQPRICRFCFTNAHDALLLVFG